MTGQFDPIKAVFTGIIANLEGIAPRETVLAAAQAAVDLERLVDGFVASADAEDAKG